MSEKKIRVMFELPEKWIDYDDPIFGLGHFLHERLDMLLREKVVNVLIKKIKLPKIKISAKEVKNRMLTILAEKALEERNGQ